MISQTSRITNSPAAHPPAKTSSLSTNLPALINVPLLPSAPLRKKVPRKYLDLADSIERLIGLIRIYVISRPSSTTTTSCARLRCFLSQNKRDGDSPIAVESDGSVSEDAQHEAYGRALVAVDAEEAALLRVLAALARYHHEVARPARMDRLQLHSLE